MENEEFAYRIKIVLIATGMNKLIGLLVFLALAGTITDGLAQTEAKKRTSSSASPAAKSGTQSLIIQLDEQIPLLLDSANIPGLSLAVIRDGKVAIIRAYGVRSAETREKVDVNTVFDAASLSKAVFAYAALQYVDQGLLDLDKPLYQYLPYPDIRYDDRYQLITARMVLSHSSGFPNWRDGDSLRIQFKPGERFSYSGEGFVYLQKVVEKISGQSLNELAAEKVFKPLGMTHSSYVWHAGFEGNFALSHDGFGNTAGKNKPKKGNAAYSLQTTAQDYARFVVAILNGSGLKKSTAEQMLTTQIRVTEEKFNPSAPLSKTLSWGLGLGLQQTNEGKSFWHWGDNNTYKCYVVAYPKTKTGVVFFTNGFNGLGIAKEMVQMTVGGQQPALDYLGYDSYQAPGSVFRRHLYQQGVGKAIKPFLDANGKSTVKEEEMNNIGYQLLRLRKLPEAAEVFRLNVEAYPASANVYDSYAEACLAKGDNDKAAQNYLKAFGLNPKNTNAKRLADQLTPGHYPKGNTVFKLKGHPDARVVTLAGSFNHWNALHTLLIKEGDEWVGSIDLTPGQYTYKFVVDGDWILDPANAGSAEENGHKNSILLIK